MATAFGGRDVMDWIKEALEGSWAGQQAEYDKAQRERGTPPDNFSGYPGAEEVPQIADEETPPIDLRNNAAAGNSPKSVSDYINNLYDPSKYGYSTPGEPASPREFSLRRTPESGGSDTLRGAIKSSEPDVTTSEEEPPSGNVNLWGGTFVPEGGTAPKGKRNAGTFSATGVAPSSRLEEGIKYNMYESPDASGGEGADLASKIARFRDVAITKIGYDPDAINPTKQAHEDFIKNLPALFRHVFQGRAVWNNLTPDQEKFWESAKSQYITRKTKEYATTKKDGEDTLKTMMSMFSQEIGRDAGTRTAAPGSYITDKSGNIIGQMPEKAPTPAQIKSAFSTELTSLKGEIALELINSPEESKALANQPTDNPNNLMALLMSGQLKSLPPEKKREYMERMKEIGERYSKMQQDTVGSKPKAKSATTQPQGAAGGAKSGGVTKVIGDIEYKQVPKTSANPNGWVMRKVGQ